jgi:hypothetical protein
MATDSKPLPLGSKLPVFSLVDVVTEKHVSSHARDSRPGTLVMFICNHCPFVVHVRDEIARVGNEAKNKGLDVFAINSNSLRTYPQDGPPHMRAWAVQAAFAFPFLFDRTQDVARSFQAACTPEFYLFDADDKLVYAGQLDDSRPSNGKPVTGLDLRRAIDTLLAGGPPLANQHHAVGCGIKWD